MGNMKDIGLLDCEDRPSIEENFKRVQGGGGGGGGAILDSNGKLKSEVLPEGYPYKTVKERTVEHIPDDKNHNTICLDGFPVFSIGDTVKLKVDGVEYSLIAYDDGGFTTIGDLYSSVQGGTGEYGWQVYVNHNKNNEVSFYSNEPHTVSWDVTEIATMANEFLNNDVAQYGKVGALTRIEWDGNTTGLDRFTDNACVFYKVSDFTVPYSQISSVKAERSDGYEPDEYDQTQYGWSVNGYTAAVVTDAESNNIPSNGVYFRCENNGLRCLWMEIDTRKENTVLYLNSSSGVKYAITVDDSGTLKATQA